MQELGHLSCAQPVEVIQRLLIEQSFDKGEIIFVVHVRIIAFVFHGSMCESAVAKYDILLAFSGIDAERRLEYREPSGPGLRHARFAGLRMGRVAS